jgi:hypothetical protein
MNRHRLQETIKLRKVDVALKRPPLQPSPDGRGQRGGGRQELRNKILRPFYWAFYRFQVRRDDHESYGHFRYHSNQHLHGYPILITTQLITFGSAWGSAGVNIGSARCQLLAQRVQCVRSVIALTVHHRSSAATGAFAAACVSVSSPLIRRLSVHSRLYGRLDRLCRRPTRITMPLECEVCDHRSLSATTNRIRASA